MTIIRILKKDKAVIILLLVGLDSIQGFQHSTSSGTFGITKQAISESSVTTCMLKKDEENTISPEIIFDTKSPPTSKIEEVKEDNACDAIVSHHPDIRSEYNAEDTKSVHYEIAIEAAYDIDDGKIYEEDKVKVVKGWFSRAVSLYMHCLGTSALVTKCMTSGFIGGIGDICAQNFEHQLSGSAQFALNRRRILGMAFECSMISGPLMHYAYEFLEKIVPIHDSENDSNQLNDHRIDQISPLKRWAAATFHVVSDTFLLGPIYVLSIMLTSSVFEGRIGTFQKELAADFFPTLRVSIYSSLGFMPMQILAFRMLPSQFRLLYMNIQDIVWNAIVSFMAHKSRH